MKTPEQWAEEELEQARARIATLEAERDRLAGSLAVCGVIAREGDGCCLPEYETDSVLAVRAMRAENERLREAIRAWERVGELYADDEGRTVIEARRLTEAALKGEKP